MLGDGPEPEIRDQNNVNVQCAAINVTDKQLTVNADDEPTDDDATRAAHNDDGITLQTQHSDPVLAQMIDYLQRDELPQDDKTARRIVLTKDQFTIRDDKLMHLSIKRQKNNQTDQPVVEQVCIPRNLQPILLARYHSQLMHCGYEKMYLTMKQRVYWDNMYTDIRNYVAQCETCHTAKANKHPIKAKIRCREIPPQIFQRVHIDHVKIAVKGATHGYTHALVMVDAMSLCCEIAAVKSTSAAETCRVLMREWIARYGVFSELVTDRHGAFTGKLTKLLTEWCGIRHVLISPYHSRSNGLAEKMNDMVLQGLRTHCKNLQNWPQLCAPIAAAYKAAVIPSRNASPFQLMFGVEMRLPVESELAKQLPAHVRPTENIDTIRKQLAAMRAQAQKSAQNSRQRGADVANKNKATYDFQPGDRVYKKRDVLGDDDDRKTASKFEGPFIILERGPNDVYKLANLHTGKILKNYIHVDKLKSSAGARVARGNIRKVNCLNMHDEPDEEVCDLMKAFGSAKLGLYPQTERGGAGTRQKTRRAIKCKRAAPRRANDAVARNQRARRKPRFPYIITRLRGHAACPQLNGSDHAAPRGQTVII